MDRENEICHSHKHLEIGVADWGHDFEGCSEQSCQWLGETGVLAEEDLWDRPPSGGVEWELLRQLGWEGYPWHQDSCGAVESYGSQQDQEADPGLT